MAVRSIIDVQLNNSAFANFQKQFDAYQKQLKGQPQAWAEVAKKIDGTRAAYDKLIAGMIAANVQAKLHEKAQERADRLTKTWSDRWREIGKSSKDFATNLKAATESILRWSVFSGVAGGLIGAGSLFGVDRLAYSAAGTRRQALGLGTSIGGLLSFEAGANRLVDPGAFLQNVGAAQHDINARIGLMSAGLTSSQIAGDPAKASIALLHKLKEIADNTNPATYTQTLQARRLDQFADWQILERLRRTSSGELAGMDAQLDANAGRFNVTDETARKWQDLATALDNAKASVQTTLINGLVELAPGITKLSEAVTHLIESLVKSPAVAHWLGLVSDGMQKLAEYVGKPEFEEKVDNFVVAIGKMADAVTAFLKLTGLGGGPMTDDAMGIIGAYSKGGVSAAVGRAFGGENPPAGSFKYNMKNFFSGTATKTGSTTSADQGVAELMARGYTYREAKAVVGNLVAESAMDPNNVNRQSGAFGLMQWLGERKRGLFAYAASVGRSPADPQVQYDYMALERSGGSKAYGGGDQSWRFRAAFSDHDMTAGVGAYVEAPSQTDLVNSMAARRGAANAARLPHYKASDIEGALSKNYVTYGKTTITIDHPIGGPMPTNLNALKSN